ncbi:MAG: Rid family hydrolase [Cyclobacteriaceae bacterium]
MKKPYYLLLLIAVLAAGCQSAATPEKTEQKVEFFGSPQSRISSGAVIPAEKSLYVISGITPSPADPDAEAGTMERMGDTKTQAISVLEKIKSQLETAGLSLNDMVSMRVYVAPDPFKEGMYDFAGWNEAYDMYFNTDTNPTKVTRATIGVPTLVNSSLFIEIEGIAVFP